MATKLEIFNMALAKLGVPAVTSLNEESKERRFCSTFYDLARDEILEQYPWHCCLMDDTLAPLVDAPEFKWDYQYDFPSDCLKIYSIYPDYIEYEVKNKKIYCNESSLQVTYHQQITDTSKFSAHVVNAIVQNLAIKLAFPLVQNSGLQKFLLEELNGMILPRARGTDVFEGTPPSNEPDNWLNARL